MDKISAVQRSRNMSKIRSKNTAPEIRVRKALQELGFKYRIHYASLPGKPDIIIPKLRTAIFVHGCFWHQHKGCKRNFMPKSNTEYWTRKLQNNVAKFKLQKRELVRQNYKVIVIWECETNEEKKLITKLHRYLSVLN